MLIQLLQLVTVAWLPGAVIFRLPWFDRERRAALDAEERAFWAVILSVAVSLSFVLALAAVHRYSFARLIGADVLVAVLAAIAAKGRLRFGPAATRLTRTAILPLALAAICLWRFFPPAEYIIGGKDPGTYINEGIQIAQKGALVIRDPVVAEVPAFARNLFFPPHQVVENGTLHQRSDYYGIRFMGFFLKDPSAGTVVGQFPHLFPASIAIGYGIDGLSGARRTVGAWALLGVLAVYFTAVRFVGRTAAVAAGGLLALHVIQVWFARYPNAEVVMQALLFAALLANARAHVDGDRFFAPVAGGLLGLLLFLRFDAVLGVAGILAGLALSTINRQRPRISFFAVLAVSGALATAYLLGPMRAYAELPIVFISSLPWWQYGVLCAAAAAAVAVPLAASRRPRLSAFLVRWAPLAIVAVLWLLAFYALFFRAPGGKLAARDAYALRMFVDYYLTLAGLGAALIGLTLTAFSSADAESGTAPARRGFWKDPALVLTIAIFSCFFFFKIRIQSDHFWMTRRFLPVILPGALMFASAAALGGARRGWRGAGALKSPVGLIFVALLAMHYARASAPIVAHVEYAGLIPRIEKLAESIGEDDLVIVESRNASGDVFTLGLPLAYIYGRHVLPLDSPRPDKAAFAAFIDWARTRYRRVLFIGGGGTDLLSHRYGVEPIASLRFQVPEYDAPADAYPRFVRHKEFDFGIYAFTNARPLEERWFDLDVGLRDDLHVLRFHAKEESEGRTFRWSGATSYVSVTVIHPDAREVTLWLNDGGRPAAAPAADVTVFLHNESLGVIRVRQGFAPYTLAIPPALAARAAAFGDPVELKLVTTVWNPHLVLGTSDDRELGVMVDRVAVR